MQAIILAAGQGTRLKKYTENLPKGMLMFNGKTIIERQIEEYRAAGIKDIILCKENEKDILEIKPIYLKGLTFHYVEDICQVTDFALLKEKCEK